MKIKICGLTRPCDIEAVNVEKPDYIGFVFAESRRRVSPGQAENLRKILSAGIIPVGVFLNEPAENILALVYSGIIDVIQLHGSESEEYIRELKRLADKPVIKANGYSGAADYLLFDNIVPGSGQVFDWNIIGEPGKPYFLAGGLNLENIGEAIAQTAPFGVDVSSGVETGGFKDPVKIKEFIRRVRNNNGK